MIDRRKMLATGLATMALPLSARVAGKAGFVRRQGRRLRRDGVRYPVIGTTMWYAAYLGADRPFGDRPRLLRELDRLATPGVNNVRLLGGLDWGAAMRTAAGRRP